MPPAGWREGGTSAKWTLGNPSGGMGNLKATQGNEPEGMGIKNQGKGSALGTPGQAV